MSLHIPLARHHLPRDASMALPDLGPSLTPERALERTPLGPAWAAQDEAGLPVTAIVVAPELLALVADRDALVAALRAVVIPAGMSTGALLPLLDVPVAPDGVPVLVLPREERAPTAARLASAKVFATGDVADAARALGQALVRLHALGLRHGAIAPGFTYLGGGAPPRLAGAGIAEAFVQAGADRAAVLATLGARGTAAPELPAAAADVRGDIHALGATLYACMTGKPPFGGRTTAFTMAAVLADEGLSGEMQRLPKGDAAAQAEHQAATERLTQALLRAVERAPDDRWHSAADMVRALDPRDPTPPEQPKVAAKARAGCLGSVLLLVAGVLGATAAWLA